MTTGKTIALTRWTFVTLVMSLLFNMLCRFVIAFLQGAFNFKESFNFMAAVTVYSDLGAQENKVCHCFHFSPFICREGMGLDAVIFIFLNVEF